MKVLTEDETLDAICAGTSIGRIGDGEIGLVLGRGIKSQRYDRRLASKIVEVLRVSGADGFLAGIVRRDKRSPKRDHAEKCLRGRCADFYTAKLYGSAYITRPDCAPWIDRPDYWDKIQSLWRDRDVVLVRGSTKSLTADLIKSARSVHEIVQPRKDAFDGYDDLLREIIRDAGDRRILLCLGPTATALALDLHTVGKHALDLGHVGMFLKKHWRGERMAVTPEDKAA